MPIDPNLALLQQQLVRINAQLASGILDIRDGTRSTTFDNKTLQSERLRIEAQIRAAGGAIGGQISTPTVRRLLTTQHTKGY